MPLYVYPKLPSKYNIGGIRLSGGGLGNCMLVYARAVKIAEQYQLPLITPTWLQFNIGPYLRAEKDKRHYTGIFQKNGLSGLQKLLKLRMLPHYQEAELENIANHDISKGVIIVEGLKKRFAHILHDHAFIKAHFLSVIRQHHVANIHPPGNAVAVHIRLGDYPAQLRMTLFWYATIVNKIRQVVGNDTEIHIFSDGTDDELKDYLKMHNCRRVFYGSSAISDIIALSNYKMIIASDSTFSAWGSYLGQVPVIYYKRRFGRVLADETMEVILKETDDIPENIVQYLKSVF